MDGFIAFFVRGIRLIDKYAYNPRFKETAIV
jgi:hypothetical protein